VSKSAGISLPADVKAAAAHFAATKHGKNLSTYVRDMLKAKLKAAGYKIEELGDSFETAAKAKLKKAASVKERR
jgi:gas vesicle protein